MPTVSAPARRRVLRHGAVCATLVSALLAAAPAAAAAQATTKIPEIPAFVFLSVTPSDIARPTTARDLAVGLSNVVDSTGQARQGVGINFQPWFTFGAPVTRKRYRESALWYTLANLDVSFGSARSAGSDTTSTDVALGAKTVFFDRSDPLASAAVAKGVDSVARVLCPNVPSDDPTANRSEVEKRLKCLNEKTDSVYQAAARRGDLRGAALSGAVAIGGRLAESRLDGLRYSGVSSWLTGSLPLSRTAQFLLQTRFDRRETADSTTNAFSTGARATFGGRRANSFVEMLGQWSDRGSDRSTAKWSAGLEVLTTQELWLAVGFGSTFATQLRKDPMRLIANVRWALAPGPRLGADRLGAVP